MLDATDTALIAVGGVVFGAVASGGVQSYVAGADRRRGARAAARLLYMNLHAAHNAVGDLREVRDWRTLITDWKVFGVVWDRHSENLAQALDTTSFQVVAAAFGCLASLTLARDLDLGVPWNVAPGFDPTDKLLALYVANIDAARTGLLKSSFRWWERRKRDRAVANHGVPPGFKTFIDVR